MRATSLRPASHFLGAAAAAALCLSTPRAARAADDDERRFVHEVGLVGGLHLFHSDHGLGRYEEDPKGLSPDHAGAFGVRIGINIVPRLAIEGELLASPTRTRNDATALTVLGYRGSLVLHLIPSGSFRPFVLAGLGGLTSFAEDDTVVDSDSDGQLHAGLGAKILLTPRVGFRVDGRVLVPPAVASDLVEVGDETVYTGPDFEVLASLYFNLSEIERPRPAPPPPPPPPSDRDKDGILDEADRCPDEPEDKDGFEDGDGCPDPDNDGDGIADGEDKCPLVAETKNGVDDEDGCPEEDTDGDGIVGSQDKCPAEPETKNSYQDDDGCPDEVPVEVKKFTGVIEGINFKWKSAKILKSSFPVLDRAVKVLQDYPDVKLEIQGHTDTSGTAEFNKKLSIDRAQAVKDYLVSKGVNADRLTTVGHGFDVPVADNKTAAGRAKNRRTEFKLIQATDRSTP